MQQKYLSKKIQLVVLFTLSGICAIAQGNSKIATPPGLDNNINLKVYQQAVGLGDYATAVHAVHYLIAGDPVKYANWVDTLAVLYLQEGAYQQAYIISNQQVATKGYTEMRMQVKAISAKNLQQPVEAIDAYKILFDKTARPGYGFEELQLEYGIRRLGETVATGNKLLQVIPAGDSTIVTMAKMDGKTAQQVTLKAAVHNLLGLAYIDLKDKDDAVAQLNEALKETPDFEQAKNNLTVANAVVAEKKN